MKSGGTMRNRKTVRGCTHKAWQELAWNWPPRGLGPNPGTKAGHLPGGGACRVHLGRGPDPSPVLSALSVSPSPNPIPVPPAAPVPRRRAFSHRLASRPLIPAVSRLPPPPPRETRLSDPRTDFKVYSVHGFRLSSCRKPSGKLHI